MFVTYGENTENPCDLQKITSYTCKMILPIIIINNKLCCWSLSYYHVNQHTKIVLLTMLTIMFILNITYIVKNIQVR